MGNFYFQSLTLGHKAVLEEHGYWKHIVKNWNEVIRTEHSNSTNSRFIKNWQPSLKKSITREKSNTKCFNTMFQVTVALLKIGSHL